MHCTVLYCTVLRCTALYYCNCICSHEHMPQCTQMYTPSNIYYALMTHFHTLLHVRTCTVTVVTCMGCTYILHVFYSISQPSQAVEQILRMYEMFQDKDCTTLEINPFAEDSLNRGKVYYILLHMFDLKLQGKTWLLT